MDPETAAAIMAEAARWQAIAAWVSAVATLALVVITVFYAWATHRANRHLGEQASATNELVALTSGTLRESALQRELSLRPHLALAAENNGLLRNIGKGSAFRIRVAYHEFAGPEGQRTHVYRATEPFDLSPAGTIGIELRQNPVGFLMAAQKLLGDVARDELEYMVAVCVDELRFQRRFHLIKWGNRSPDVPPDVWHPELGGAPPPWANW